MPHHPASSSDKTFRNNIPCVTSSKIPALPDQYLEMSITLHGMFDINDVLKKSYITLHFWGYPMWCTYIKINS